MGRRGRDPVAKFKFADEERQKSAGRILETDEEQNRLLDSLPAWLRLMVEFGLQTAARRGDLVKLTWRSVHPDYVEFLETKECRHREVSLSGRAQEILALLRPPGARPSAFVFEPDVPRVEPRRRAIRCGQDSPPRHPAHRGHAAGSQRDGPSHGASHHGSRFAENH